MSGYEATVNEALDRVANLGYERTGGELANHAPMGAETIAVLGYFDAVGPWIENYRRGQEHYDPPESSNRIDAAEESSWRSALGVFGRAGDWERLFRRELADEPWRAVLARWWPRLITGVFAGMTHGVIRTAHAVRGLAAVAEPSPLQLDELSRGMAYWAARFVHLPGNTTFDAQGGFAAAVAALPREGLAEASNLGELRQAWSRIDEVPGYSEALRAPGPAEAQWLLSEMTAEFAGVFLAHPEFVPAPALVHAVTAPAAVRLVLPHLPAEQHLASVGELWKMQAALLTTFTVGRQGEDAARTLAGEAEQLGFPELAARAVEHGDEHVIKFTEACMREHALRPDARYAAAVLSAQQRIPRGAGTNARRIVSG
ncbi:Protein of unknown function [Saccharopolyspora kobensis]|uniref:DUF4243 domain-containing protein n=1 Tax=Saccharopolyspora kobensis TaxID=146035 RepID=A0A1H6DNE4_9PSEU|nr:questin oxidase family protein [Saccharopolyspora kobensis]SEG86860.1 Protein of unknown function [Saccharopolyspora kobensis]SFF01637.1 Protein of unknown function [Saccharopolyspora kobensis]